MNFGIEFVSTSVDDDTHASHDKLHDAVSYVYSVMLQEFFLVKHFEVNYDYEEEHEWNCYAEGYATDDADKHNITAASASIYKL